MRLILDPGSSHGNDWAKFQELVKLCEECHAELKFQLFEQSPGNLPCNRNFFALAVELGRAKGVSVFASVWDRNAVDILEQLKCKTIKIAYGQRHNADLVNYAVRSKREIIVSYDWMDTPRRDVTPIFCIPEYPVHYLIDFNEVFKRFTGFSDHSLGISQTIKAIQMGAQIIEKHIVPENPFICPDTKFALSPSQARKLYEHISSGDGKNGTPLFQYPQQAGPENQTSGPGVGADAGHTGSGPRRVGDPHLDSL